MRHHWTALMEVLSYRRSDAYVGKYYDVIAFMLRVRLTALCCAALCLRIGTDKRWN